MFMLGNVILTGVHGNPSGDLEKKKKDVTGWYSDNNGYFLEKVSNVPNTSKKNLWVQYKTSTAKAIYIACTFKINEKKTILS